MKSFAKVAALAMALAMALALSACGGTAASSSAASSNASASASASASSAAASSASTSASAASAGKFQAGTITGDTYKSEFFGIQFKLPAGWQFRDEAYLAEMNKTVGNLLDNEAITKALENGTVFFELSAVGENHSNVNATVEYIAGSDAESVTAADYLAYTKEMLPDQMAAAGMTLKDSQLGTYKNNESGDEFSALKITVEMSGTKMYEEMICVKSGDYFMSLTATSLDQAELDSILCNVTRI